MPDKCPEYIEAFMAAIYGADYTELARSFFNEETAIKDATKLIANLREQLKTARQAALEDVDATIVKLAAAPPDTPYLKKDCCRIARHTGWARGISEALGVLRHMADDCKPEKEKRQ